jgi:putative ABC transport system ATP-binding protein
VADVQALVVPAADDVLVAQGLRKTYRVGEEEVRALDGVDLAVGRGEFVAITGPSGSGKTTLLSILAGLEVPTSGDVRLDGTSLFALTEGLRAEMRRRQVGFVFQQHNLLPILSLAENVGLPMMLAGRPEREWRQVAEQALRDVGLEGRGRHLPEQTSTGEQQRTAIARVLAARPPIVFADEPTGSLDSGRGADVLALLRRCCTTQRTTVVLVTHDAAAAAVADREIRLRDGRLVL